MHHTVIVGAVFADAMFFTGWIVGVTVVTLARLGTSAASTMLHGYGSSFADRLYMEWAAAFKAFRSDHLQLGIAYKPVGSGQGIAELLDRTQTAHYAASDALLTKETYEEHDDLQMVPTCAG